MKRFATLSKRSLALCNHSYQSFSSFVKPRDESLTNLSPLDGRYSRQTEALSEYFSEYALIKYRVKTEIDWVIFMSENEILSGLSDENKAILRKFYEDFSVDDAQRVKTIERTTNHDIKAVEYFIKEKMEQVDDLDKIKEYVHFCCTSEDINNLSYAQMITDAKKNVLVPQVDGLTEKLVSLSEEFAEVPMLARTHGQPATPTTVGKELSNFAYRSIYELQTLKSQKVLGKFNGAVGNYNVHKIVFPSFHWPSTSEQFIQSLGLSFNPYTTQIEPHDNISHLFANLTHLNTIYLDLCKDLWTYTSLHYFKLKAIKGEIGSSTMPHKVNPIDFENAEGNLGLSNALLQHFITKLPNSRMQRDLTDSTVLRNVGSAVGYGVLAYNSLMKGLNKIDVNQARLVGELDEHWEVLAEAIQTVLRRNGEENPYELLKDLTRGKDVTKEGMIEFVKSLNLSQEDRRVLLELTPANYLGYAADLAREVRKYKDEGISR